MTTLKSDPKPARRYVAKQREWKDLRRLVLSGGRCFIGRCRTPATDCHHLIPRSLRGSDVVENLIPLCHDHHMAYEDRVPGWEYIAYAIREGLSEERVAYLVREKSEHFVDSYYPLRRKSA